MKAPIVGSHSVCAALAAAGLLLTVGSSQALPTITGVVETGGDDSVGTPAQFTGQTFDHPNLGTLTLGVFAEDAPTYRDRTHQWNGATAALPIPEYLLGGEYIMIRNDNRENPDFSLEVTLSEPATVYLLIDNRLSDGGGGDPPETGVSPEAWFLMTWVAAEGFQPVSTGHNRTADEFWPDEVGVDEGGDGTGPGAGINQYSSIYSKQVEAGTFTLGEMGEGGRNMYGVVVQRLPDSANNPPEITGISPANGTLFHPAASGITFNAGTVSPNSLPAANISLTLNGADVSDDLEIGGTSTSRTVSYTSLLPNTTYHALVEVADQEGRSVSQEIRFDTFDSEGTLAVEAEDYNFGGGEFMEPATPGAYLDQIGTPGVDYQDGSTGFAANYRTFDMTSIAESGDAEREQFTSSGAADFVVTQFRSTDWMNYTRTFPEDRYYVYLRASSASAQPIRLDLITGSAAAEDQAAFRLGTFDLPGASGYDYYPLTDASGTPVAVSLSGEETLRLTAGFSANPNSSLNYLLFVPARDAAQPPYVSSIFPGRDALDVQGTAAVQAVIAGGTGGLNTEDVQLSFGGEDVTSAAVLAAGDNGLTVSYDPPGTLERGTSYPVRLVFSDAGGNFFTNEWSFTTAALSPVITGLTEMFGDDEATPPQFTGQTFYHPNLGQMTVGSFQDEVPAFRDRVHQWTGASPTLPLPDYLVGADYIMTRNDSRDNFPYQIDVTVSEPSLVYLLIDNRLSDGSGANPPVEGQDPSEWLLMDWVFFEGYTPIMTGHNRSGSTTIPDEIGMDESADGAGPGAGINQYASIYSKEVPAGTFSLFQADNAGRNMYGVVVKAAAAHNFIPEVAITSPTHGAAIEAAPGTVPITATASVQNSTITKVEFLSGSTVIGEDTSAPYTFNWSDVPAGRYYLSARATAANGETATTLPIWLTVGEVISINFQDFTAETPAGYLADTGEIFGDRFNGQTYGWDDDNSQHARNRDSAASPDERYDTFNHMQKVDPLPVATLWEIELPNGRYRVTAVAGEPSNFDSVYDLQAEGTTFVSGTPSASQPFFEGTTVVNVTDGRLTLGNGPAAVNNKIAFVDIVPAGDEPEQPELAPPVVSGGNITVSWTGGGQLQEAPTVLGPWNPVSGNPSGTYTAPVDDPQKFYRVIVE